MVTLAHGASVQSPWAYHPHPEILIAVVALGGAYAWAVGVLGPRRAPENERPVTSGRVASFYAGLALLLLSADWPLHDLADDFLFSAHMVQHLVFILAVPPLLLLGLPTWLLRSMLQPKWLFKAVRALTRPVPALLISQSMIAFIHWPAIVDLQVGSEIAHGAIHVLILGASVLMWWPVIAPLPEMGRISEPAKMFYLFLTSVIPTIPASFLTFATGVLYEHYSGVPRLWGLSAQTDQMIAGLIMKIGGGLLLWTVIAVVFFRWYAREERRQVDDVSWDDFERELEAYNLRK